MKSTFYLSVTTTDNLYQEQQQVAANEAAAELDVEIRLLNAGNDAVTQTQQLLNVIQSRWEKPAGVIVSAVGSAMPQVAQAAVSSGVGWALLNREIEDIGHLRAHNAAPVFAISPDHLEIGRTMAQQASALLPHGGRVLLLAGPSSGQTSVQRQAGFRTALPDNIEMRTIYGMWTKESGYRAAKSLLALSMRQDHAYSLLCAQNDDMALGAREAFLEAETEWSRMLYIGVDGLRDVGQALVRSGALAATQIVPTTADIALRTMVEALRNGRQPSERMLVRATPYPDTQNLKPSEVLS